MRALPLLFAACALCLAVVAFAAKSAATEPAIAIVVTDLAPLRSAPRDSAKSHALLWQGEPLEIRGEKLDYLQVYDHRLERGGYVSVKQVRRVRLDAASAADLLSILRFLRETSGSEALGIGYAAAYLRAASPEAIRGSEGAEALDALGTFADRLAARASSVASNPGAQSTLGGHLEVASRYGVVFTTYDHDSRVVLCYEGDAFRRVMAMTASDAAQRARAALALTRLECAPGSLSPTQRREADEARAALLDKIDAEKLPDYLRGRVSMRRAALWSGLAFQRARRGEATAQAAAAQALQDLARVDREALTDDDRFVYADAAMRVNASRWASMPAQPARDTRDTRARLVTAAGAPGETCVALVDAKRDAANPLAKRCTYGIVWEGSASLNREGNALAVAVQHTETWREMWVFRKVGSEWAVRALPPAATTPGVGYAEFAGWVPGGKQVLVAREATGDGRYKGRTYELLRLDTLATIGQASDPSLLPAFQRWQDAGWKQHTVSVR